MPASALPNARVLGDTRVYAIVGDPIAQARSPLVFNELFLQHDANAVLVPLHVPAPDLDVVMRGLVRIPNLGGIVVTVPHKVRLAGFVDEVLPIATRVGAINCMARSADGRWRGEMFDGEGFVAGLRRQGHDPSGWKVYQAGAGGAGRAVADALAAAGIARLDLADVVEDRAAALLANLERHYPRTVFRIAQGPPADSDMVVNATPCGMAAADPLPFSLDGLEPRTLVAELIMKPEQTALVQRAAARGHATHLGRHLLESQAEIIARFFGAIA
jgi:shikimate dehydrogenase